MTSAPSVGAPIISGLVPCNTIPDEILTHAPGAYKAMIIESSNPVHSLADSPKWRRAMAASSASLSMEPVLVEPVAERSVAQGPVVEAPVVEEMEPAEEGPEVAAAIRGFNALTPGGVVPRPDLIIVARGGGSIEDLWGFNEEIVARAAAASARANRSASSARPARRAAADRWRSNR